VHPLLAVIKQHDVPQAAAAVTAFLLDGDGLAAGFWEGLKSNDKLVYLQAVPPTAHSPNHYRF
jgi:hypothetical protein